MKAEVWRGVGLRPFRQALPGAHGRDACLIQSFTPERRHSLSKSCQPRIGLMTLPPAFSQTQLREGWPETIFSGPHR